MNDRYNIGTYVCTVFARHKAGNRPYADNMPESIVLPGIHRVWHTNLPDGSVWDKRSSAEVQYRYIPAIRYIPARHIRANQSPLVRIQKLVALTVALTYLG